MLLPFVVAFAAAVLSACVLIPLLRALKAGQPIKDIGPVWHKSKEGTPTMGGWIFIVGTAGAVVVCVVRTLLAETNGAEPLSRTFDTYGALFGLALVFGLIGFADDIKKVRERKNDGLSRGAKVLLQLAASLAFLYFIRLFGSLTPNVFVPFIGITIPLPAWVYFPCAAFVIVGTVNAVNITDGIDGVLAGVSLPVTLCLAVIAFKWTDNAVGTFALALTGALLGYLIFNFHPAKVFMGDTGSLFLGGAICAIVFALNVPLILVPLGFVYIVETLSDILQISVFKYRRITRGLEYAKSHRLFKMAPLHHHFEKCGWSEYRIFVIYTLISILCAVVAYIGTSGRYGHSGF